MLELLERGWNVSLISATRGEEGEIAEGVAATKENLGSFREGELRNAMRVLGVEDIRFLDYRDSGMAGAATNHSAAAFMRAPVDEVGGKVLAIMDELEPELMIGFGPEGVYLHPDHIAIHLGMMRAIDMAAAGNGHPQPGAVLYTSPPREWFVELWGIEGNPFAQMPFEEVERMGVPASELTHTVDAQSKDRQIREALMCHASQFGTGDPFEWLPSHLEEQFVRYNLFRRASLPWGDNATLPEFFNPLH